MLFSALLFLVSTQTGCRTPAPGDGGVPVLSLDLDGDAVPDEVRVVDREAQLKLSKSPELTRLDLGWEVFGGMLVPLGELPLKGSAHREEALRFIEDRIFDKTCATADPSLQRLLQQQRRARSTPLNWIKGPVQAPFAYLLRQKESWLLYRSFCYVPNSNLNAWGPVPPWEAARDGKLVVLKTCHGVVLNDLENNRYAWLYLTDQAIDKLRHSSIGDVAIAEGVVTIRLTLDTDDDPEFTAVKVRVADGSITVVKAKRSE